MDRLDKIIEKIEDHIPELEEERLRLNNYKMKVQVFGFLALLFILGACFKSFGMDAFPILMPLGIMIGAGIYYTSREGFDYFKQQFKKKIINTIIKEFNPNLTYVPDGHIKRTDYYQSKIFTKDPYNYKGEDYISGKLNATDFRMSELHTMEEIKGEDDEGTLFQGIFMVADFHKYFHSETYVLPQTEWQALGLNKRTHEGADLIYMENEEFERNFRVFTTSDQDARYILSPSMMERIIELQYKYGSKIAISFRGSSIYIALTTKLDFFEHDMSQPVAEQSLIHGHLKDLKKMLATIDELNLNTRIWSKMPKHIRGDKRGI